MEKMEHIIHDGQENQRIDKILVTLNEEWSRTQVQQWIKEGLVLVNGKEIKANYKTALHDLIEITIPEPKYLMWSRRKWNWIFTMKTRIS